MEQIIEGRIFDTEKAQIVASNRERREHGGH